MALLNKSKLTDNLAHWHIVYAIRMLCGILNSVIRFSDLTIAIASP